jgi:hypothetical protein
MACFISSHPEAYNIFNYPILTLFKEALMLRFGICLADL